MSIFRAAFIIVEEHNCPLYDLDERFVLTDKSVEFGFGRAACLILSRELTGILGTLIPHITTEFAECRQTTFNCGGCTGLIKFRLTDAVNGFPNAQQIRATKSSVDDESVMIGKIEAILPAELLQVFHMHQKTGRLILDLESGPARVTFREGGLLAARFNDLDNQEAVHAILTEKKGTFEFVPGLPESLMKAREIGDFMMILMEGLKRLDEEDG